MWISSDFGSLIDTTSFVSEQILNVTLRMSRMYFLGIAKLASRRSHDVHTQHGCVITDSNNRILGVSFTFPGLYTP